LAVDVGDIALLKPYDLQVSKSRARKILIDHHGAPDGALSNSPFDQAIVQVKATSTCEIIALGIPFDDITKKLAEILLVGLLFDSQHLGIATARTLEAALALVRKGAQIDLAKEVLKSKPDRSEIIARMKSAQRMQVSELGRYFLVKTEVSSFHASVARMLIEIGADVGIAYGEVDEESRLSVRCAGQFLRDTSIDVGMILEKIAKEKNLVGGGHPSAASISGKITTSELVGSVSAMILSSLP